MSETNRPKLNLNVLKWNTNIIKKTENISENSIKKENTSNIKTSNISNNTGIEKQTQVKLNISKPSISINKNIQPIKSKIQNNNIITQQNTEKQVIPKIKEEIITDKKTSINTNKEEVQEIQNNTQKNIITEKEKNTINNNQTPDNINWKNTTWEIFSWYTSDFIWKKEEALKESKKIRLPDSPKKIFFAVFSSLIILTWLAFIIIFKINSPITNKLKTNILEITWHKIDKKIIKEIPKKELWTKQNITKNWFKITYQISNEQKYKIDSKIFINKIEFDKYLLNKIEKLKINKLKKHIQDEKIVK